jgi:hypothetical protein
MLEHTLTCPGSENAFLVISLYVAYLAVGLIVLRRGLEGGRHGRFGAQIVGADLSSPNTRQHQHHEIERGDAAG